MADMTEIDIHAWAGKDTARCSLALILAHVELYARITDHGDGTVRITDEEGDEIGYGASVEAAIRSVVTREITTLRGRDRDQFAVLRQLDAALAGVHRIAGGQS